MNLNVGKELAALRRMSVGDLRLRYAEVFGETTNTRHRDWLVKRIIWRMQATAEGDLTARARRRAAELANDADLRRRPPKAPTDTPEAPTRIKTARLRTNGDARIPLGARNTSRGWFAVSLDEDSYFEPIPIEEDDVRQSHVSLPEFVDCLRRHNAIVGSEAVADDNMITVGQKLLEGHGAVEVYLAVENHDTSTFLSRCRAIQRPHGVKQVVVLTPRPVPLANAHRELLDARGVIVVSLASAAISDTLAIDCPKWRICATTASSFRQLGRRAGRSIVGNHSPPASFGEPAMSAEVYRYCFVPSVPF